MILRAGTGSGSLSSNAAAVFLDEYTPTGTLIQSIAMPSSGTTAFTLSGNQSTEGILNWSQDGALVTFVGYRKNAGGTNPSLDVASTTNRVIATLNLSGAVTTSLAMTDVSGVISSATSVDGSKFYVAGPTGVRYVNGSAGTMGTTQLASRLSRHAMLRDDRLIVSNASASVNQKIDDYGVLPTTVTTPASLVAMGAGATVHGFFLADLDPAIAGDDTMYLIRESNSELWKYAFDGTSWTSRGSISSGTARNITGVIDGTDVTLYVTSPSGLFTFTDTTGTGTLTTTSLGTAVFTAPANTGFRGVVVVPEPTGIALVIGLAAGLLRRRRR